MSSNETQTQTQTQTNDFPQPRIDKSVLQKHEKYPSVLAYVLEIKILRIMHTPHCRTKVHQKMSGGFLMFRRR